MSSLFGVGDISCIFQTFVTDAPTACSPWWCHLWPIQCSLVQIGSIFTAASSASLPTTKGVLWHRKVPSLCWMPKHREAKVGITAGATLEVSTVIVKHLKDPHHLYLDIVALRSLHFAMCHTISPITACFCRFHQCSYCDIDVPATCVECTTKCLLIVVGWSYHITHEAVWRLPCP